MNYIYDILVNFKKELYDFYEWDTIDNIDHVRKIPLFKINSEHYKLIQNHIIKIESDIKEQIAEKTELFTSKSVVVLPYACLITDGLEVMALKFNENGVSVGRSRLLIDEENEVIDVCEQMENEKFEYQLERKLYADPFITRKDLEKKRYIMEELNKLDEDEELEKLKYLYYECFNEREENRNFIINKIKEELKNNWEQISNQLYQFFKLTSLPK